MARAVLWAVLAEIILQAVLKRELDEDVRAHSTRLPQKLDVVRHMLENITENHVIEMTKVQLAIIPGPEIDVREFFSGRRDILIRDIHAHQTRRPTRAQ